jgi:hypothetical protein
LISPSHAPKPMALIAAVTVTVTDARNPTLEGAVCQRERGDERVTADPGDFNDPCSLFGSKTKQFLVRDGERERESADERTNH